MGTGVDGEYTVGDALPVTVLGLLATFHREWEGWYWTGDKAALLSTQGARLKSRESGMLSFPATSIFREAFSKRQFVES